MSKFLVAAVLLSLANHGADMATAWDDKDFFRYCPPYSCSKHGPEIRFPLRLKSNNTSSSCGGPCMGMELACSGQDTILVHPVLGPCKVTAIDYSRSAMNITQLLYSSSPCPLKELFSRSIPIDAYEENQGPCPVTFYEYNTTLVCCPREFTPTSSIYAAEGIAGPVSCLSNATHFLYLVDASEPISIFPPDCKVCSDAAVPIPYLFKSGGLSFAEITLDWYVTGQGIWCPDCERQGRHCAFSSQRNQTFCMPHAHGIASNWPKVPYSCT